MVRRERSDAALRLERGRHNIKCHSVSPPSSLTSALHCEPVHNRSPYAVGDPSDNRPNAG